MLTSIHPRTLLQIFYEFMIKLFLKFPCEGYKENIAFCFCSTFSKVIPAHIHVVQYILVNYHLKVYIHNVGKGE